jgi:hypothetical protein
VSPSAKTAVDWGFKLVSLLVIPTFGWAWNLNSQIAVMENRIGVLETKAESRDEQDTQIALIQRDVDYIKDGIDSLKRFHGAVP